MTEKFNDFVAFPQQGRNTYVTLDLDDPVLDGYSEKDIANMLAVEYRWSTKHWCRKISVAEHSYHAALLSWWICRKENLSEIDSLRVAYHLLHHDDHEAIIGDVIRPIGRLFGSALETLKENFQRSIMRDVFSVDYGILDSNPNKEILLEITDRAHRMTEFCEWSTIRKSTEGNFSCPWNYEKPDGIEDVFDGLPKIFNKIPLTLFYGPCQEISTYNYELDKILKSEKYANGSAYYYDHLNIDITARLSRLIPKHVEKNKDRVF